MSERLAKRRRVESSSETTGPEVAVFDERTQLYSIIDPGSWNGFCEIESEPVSDSLPVSELPCLTVPWQALFNVMLREFGVKNVKVQEVVSLDDSMLELLPYAHVLASKHVP